MKELVPNQAWRLRLIAVACFALSSWAAFAAQDEGRPITAAIAYLLGVTLVAALQGIRGGVIAAIAASIIYNFFLSEPAFAFMLTSAEDYAPLLAFNLAAVASGIIAGRLKDRALAAEFATSRLAALLEASRLLQAAVRVEDLAGPVASFFAKPVRASLFAVRSGTLAAIGDPADEPFARHMMESGRDRMTEGSVRGFVMRTSDTVNGILIIDTAGAAKALHDSDAEAFAGLLSIALDRCLLLEKASEAELLRRSEEFKTTLLSSVSHDLRTPLSAISASASSLARLGSDLAPETQSDLLLMIQEQCDRLNRYTTNLLNLVRLQSGLDPAGFQECDPLEVLGTAIARVRALGTGHAIGKSYALRASTVRADPVMLEQLFYNVLENAVRYSPSDAPIEVSARTEAGSLRIDIKDGGPGIPAKDRSRIFDRFYRGQAASSEGGTGLGLSIAKGFAEAFGGSIRIGSGDPDQKTIVSIFLPRMTAT